MMIIALILMSFNCFLISGETNIGNDDSDDGWWGGRQRKEALCSNRFENCCIKVSIGKDLTNLLYVAFLSRARLLFTRQVPVKREIKLLASIIMPDSKPSHHFSHHHHHHHPPRTVNLTEVVNSFISFISCRRRWNFVILHSIVSHIICDTYILLLLQYKILNYTSAHFRLKF